IYVLHHLLPRFGREVVHFALRVREMMNDLAILDGLPAHWTDAETDRATEIHAQRLQVARDHFHCADSTRFDFIQEVSEAIERRAHSHSPRRVIYAMFLTSVAPVADEYTMR